MSEGDGALRSLAGLKTDRWRKPAASLLALLAELVVLLLLVALPLLFFWRLVTPNPSDQAHIAWGDLASQYYPLRLFVARALAQGHLPLWNPYLNGGQPALADAQSAVFYPPNRLLAALAPNGELDFGSLERYVIAHFVMAGVFTYLFARYAFRRHSGPAARLAALLVALTFTFGGYLTSFPVQQLTILEAGIWLPLLLLLLDLALSRRSLLFFALAALPLALSWLAGHAQTTMYAVYLAAAYAAFRLAIGWRGWRDLTLVAGAALTFGAGTALAAVQLLPTYEFLRLSTRVDLAYRDTSFGLPFPELVGLLLPGVFGGRTLYVGMLALALAALAVALHRRFPLARFWLGAALAGLAVSLGGNTFLYSFLYLVVPGFGAVRDQERAVLVLSFAAAVLAGHGLVGLIGGGERELRGPLAGLRRLALWTALASGAFALFLLVGRTLAPPSAQPTFSMGADRALFGALLLLLVAGLLWLRQHAEWSPGPLAALAIVLLVLDLFSQGWQANLIDAKDAQLYGPNKTVDALAGAGAGGALWRLSSEGLLPGGGSGASVYQLRDVVANTPFQLKAYAEATAALDEFQRSRLLDVGFWLTKRQLEKDGRFTKVGEFGDVRLYALSAAASLPRFHVVHDLRVVPDDAALRQLALADLSKVAILSQSAAGQQLPPVEPAVADEKEPQLLLDAPDRQVLAADLTSPGLLVASEVSYPGWRVFVDETERPLLTVQYLLRGVALPAGRHRVEFRFAPASLQQGLVVSQDAAAALAALICISLAWWAAIPLRRMARRA